MREATVSQPFTPVPSRNRIRRGPRRGVGRTLAVVSLATVCAIPTAGAWAATHVGASARKVVHKPVRPAPAPARPKAPAGAVVTWPWGQALHGQLTVPAGTTTQSVILQHGSITAVTATTVTVTSTDGYTTSWTLTTATKVSGRPPARAPRPTRTNTTSTSAPTSVTTTGLAVGQSWDLGRGHPTPRDRRGHPAGGRHVAHHNLSTTSPTTTSPRRPPPSQTETTTSWPSPGPGRVSSQVHPGLPGPAHGP
jgi:hypothetical protein